MSSAIYNPLDDIMAHEQGELDAAGTLRLFSHLVRTGKAWSLQGHYGRTAQFLIQAGWIEANSGRILRELDKGADHGA